MKFITRPLTAFAFAGIVLSGIASAGRVDLPSSLYSSYSACESARSAKASQPYVLGTRSCSQYGRSGSYWFWYTVNQ